MELILFLVLLMLMQSILRRTITLEVDCVLEAIGKLKKFKID